MHVELRDMIFFVAVLKSPAIVTGVIHYFTSFYPGSLFFPGYFDCMIVGAVNNVIVMSLAISLAGYTATDRLYIEDESIRPF